MPVRKRLLVVVICLAVGVSACSVEAVRPAPQHPRAASRSTESVPPPASPVPSRAPRPVFEGTIAPVPLHLAGRMRGTTWRPGCPVPIDGLRLLTLSYWDLDGN